MIFTSYLYFYFYFYFIVRYSLFCIRYSKNLVHGEHLVFAVAHDTCFLVVTYSLFKEVGFTR
jgi:hypothetical protein